VASVAEQLAPVLDRPRFLAVLFGTLAVVALLLVALGLYAVTGFEAARRRSEMGLRLALGASARHVRGRIVRLALVPVIAGTVLGLGATWFAARFVQASFPDIDARVGLTYAF